MMFYNGFNLLIDLVVAGITGFVVYQVAWAKGYANAVNYLYDYFENAEQYAADQARESI